MSKKKNNGATDQNTEAATGKKKRKHKKLRVLIAISIAIALCGAGLGVGLLFIPKDGLKASEGYYSVSYEVEEGEVYSPDKGYSGLDIFGKLNWTFQQKDEWYASFHSTVSTTVDQDVRTLKQFRRANGTGILISADISRSSLVNLARQFCYILPEDGTGGRVIWREASGGPSTYNGFDTPWEEGDPKGNMMIDGADGFRAKNGLPANELSVYIFRDETVLQTETVVKNADGTYTVTYHLNPEVWETEEGTSAGAAVYYCNQMKFTGGLTDVPTFDVIDVSFTFNENWEVLRTDIHEEYSATMGFTVGCSADSVTEYSYTTPFAPISDAYEEYFKDYAQSEAIGSPEPTLDNMGALTAAFAPVINGPTTLGVDLTVNGKPVKGLVYVDLHTNGALPSFDSEEGIADFIDKLEVRAKLGNVGLYVQDGAAYLNAGDMKIKLTLGELVDLLGGVLGGNGAEGDATEGTETEGGADPLAALMDAELVHEAGSGKASAHAELDLGGVVIPIDFNYFIEEETLSASLDNVQTAFSLQDIALSARLGFSDEAAPAALTDTENYTELSTHIQNLIALFGADVLHADISYEGYGLKVTGGVNLALKDDVRVAVTLFVTYQGERKRADIGYEKGVFYLDLDGVRIFAGLNDAAALLKQYLPQTQAETADFSLSSLIDTLLFTTTLTDNIAIGGDETALEILIKAGELVKAFGFDLGSFDLGTVKIGVTERQLTVEALGARLSVQRGVPFSVDTEGYSDAMHYVQELIGMLGSDVLHADVAYSGYGINVAGGLDLNLNGLIAAGNFTVSYGEAEKQLAIVYQDDILYLDLDGVKLAANVQDAIALVKGLLGAEEPKAAEGETGDRLDEILTLIFSFRFGDVLTVGDTEIAIDGTKLLKALGVDFKLGNVKLTVEDETFTVEALGATVTLKAGAAFETETDGYTDITEYAMAVAGLIQGGYLAADVSYEGYGLTVGGKLDLDLRDFNNIIAAGNFTVTYGDAAKQLAVIYKGGVIYLDIDGIKLGANVQNAIALAQGILDAVSPEAAQNEGATDVLAKVFSFRFGDVITIGEEGSTLNLAVKGTELLTALGVDFKLGDVTFDIATEGKISVKAFGADIELAAGSPFEVTTEGYVDIMRYALTVAELATGKFLAARVTYSGYGLEVEGRLSLATQSLIAKGKFIISYGDAEKALTVIYKDDILYLDLDGVKLAANVKDAIALVQGLLGAEEPKAAEGETGDRLEEILTLIFSFRLGDMVTVSNEEIAIDGSKLLKALGIDFDFGNVKLSVAGRSVTAELLGAAVTLTAGAPFSAATTGYTDITEYAKAVASLIQKGYLSADVSYSGYGLTVEGTLNVDIHDFSNIVAEGTFTVKYGTAAKTLTVIYAGGDLYLNIDGVKLAANVKQAIAIVESFLAKEEPDAGTAETKSELDKVLEKVFGITFGDVLKVESGDETVNLTIEGTELLTALGVEFNLGQVTLDITKAGEITAKALGATVTITEGEEFPTDTSGYVAITEYAKAVASLIQGGYLAAEVKYEGYGLTVEGKLNVDIHDFNAIVAEGTFTVTYGEAEKPLTVIYAGGDLYLDIDGVKLAANVKQAIAIVESFLAKEEPNAGDQQTKSELDKVLEKVFGITFGDVLTVTGTDDMVKFAIEGTELLKALGVEFHLGQVTLDITKSGTITAKAADLGVEITIKEGKEFPTDTSGYVAITEYAEAVAGLIQGGYLSADVKYEGYGLVVSGTLNVDIHDFNNIVAEGAFTVKYGEAEKPLTVIYTGGDLYLDIDGVKLAANVKQAIAIVESFLANEEPDADATETKSELDKVLEKVFGITFGDVLTVTGTDDTVKFAIEGTELLSALGVEFNLGQVTLDITKAGEITAKALGATVTITAGTPFSAATTGYTDITEYAEAVAKLIQKGYLSADVSYSGYGLTVEGTLNVDIHDFNAIVAEGTFTVKYGEAEKALTVIYAGGDLYLDIDGVKLAANVKQAIAIVESFLAKEEPNVEEPETKSELDKVLEKVFGITFGDVLTVTGTDDTVKFAIEGTELLTALGVEFNLGEVTLDITKAREITAKALGATVTIAEGKEFPTDTSGYVAITEYAEAVASLIQGGYLSADVSYSGYGLTVEGTLNVDIKDFSNIVAKGEFTVTYGTAAKALTVIYTGGDLYLNIDGVKLAANVKQAIAIVKSFLANEEASAGDVETKSDLDKVLEKVFGITFGDVLTVTGTDDTVKFAIEGTELLKALGVEFNLGEVTLDITKAGEITAKALGATVTITEGEEFPTDTSGYVAITDYAAAVAGLIQGGYLSADVSYSGYGLTVEGTLNVDIHDFNNIVAKGEFTVKYGTAEKQLTVIYKGGDLYLNIDGVKLAANVQQVIAIVESFLAKEEPDAGDAQTKSDLDKVLEKVFGITFGDVLKVESGDETVNLTIEGTELLTALGVEFNLGQVTLDITKSGTITAKALGATVTITEGDEFQTDTSGYVAITEYAEAVAKLIQKGYLSADVSYSGYGLTVEGTLNVDIHDFNAIVAEGTFTVKYGEAEKALTVIYAGGDLYLDIDGVKLAANVKQAIAIVESFLAQEEPDVGTTETKSDLDKVLEKVFGITFGDVLTVTGTDDTVKFAIEGTELLKALGVEFNLGEVTLDITKSGTITAKALGATVTIKEGASFEAKTDGYVAITEYAKAVASLIQDGYLSADVKYEGYGLTVEGELNVDIHDFNNIVAKGEFTVKYGEAEKALTVIYKGGDLYLDIDGVKLAANVKQAIAIVESFLAQEEPGAGDAETKSELDKVLEKVFGITFGDVLTVTGTDDTVKFAIEGTELLTALGVEFNLGQVTLDITKAGEITAKALGATVTITEGAPFEAKTDGYVAITEYAKAVAGLIQKGYLSADVSYSGYGLTVEGTLNVDIHDFNNVIAEGTFTVKYGEAEKQLTVIYTGGDLYLNIDGVKLAANVKQAIAIVESFLAKEEPNVEDPQTKSELDKVLEKVFGITFGDVLKVESGDETVKFAIEGTELLTALGVEFNLGEVTLDITKSGEITAKALGATVTIAEGAPFEAKTDGYVAITEYAEAVAELIQKGYLAADVSYSGYGLTVEGKLDLNIQDFNAIVAEGNFTLVYGKINKQITVAYTQNGIYLTLDGLKLMTDATKAIALIESILMPANSSDPAAEGEQAQEKVNLEKVLEKIFAFHFGDVLTVTEANDTVSLAITGTELLDALGVKFELGNVTLGITKTGEITAKAADLGVAITIKEGAEFAPETDGFTELTPVLQKLPAVLNAKALALKGTFIVTVGDTEIALEIKNGVLAWSEGINFYLDAELCLNKTALPIKLHINGSEVEANICGYGIKLAYSDLPMLENALFSIYQRIYKIASEMFVEGTTNPLPDVGSFDELLDILKGTGAAAAALDGMAEEAETSSFDWTELVQSILLGASEKPNGIAHAEYQGLTLDILNQIGEGGFIGLVLGYETSVSERKISVTADLGVNVYTGEFPGMIDADLTAEEIENFLGYIGSAIELFETKDLTLTLDGKVTSTDKEAYPPAEGEEFGTKYDIHASMTTHRGESNIIHLDVDGNHLWVDADVFAHASINITATNSADTSIYIDLYILDGAPTQAADGSMTYTKDNMLDFYVTLSQLDSVENEKNGSTVAGYNPVRLYAPSQEILPILSSAIAMLGVDADILNNYMVNYWLSLENVAQLKALGTFILPLLGENVSGTIGQVNSLFAQLGTLFTSSEKAEAEPKAASLAEADAPADRKTISVWDYLKALEIGKEELNITLDSQTIYGIAGLDDVQAVLTKTADSKDENGTYTYGKFKTLDLLNIYDKTGTLNTSLKGTVSYEPVADAVPAGTYNSFLGADQLILALAKSATHGVDKAGSSVPSTATPDHYALNNNFYIDGTITITVLRREVTVKTAISVDIDKSGDVGITVHIEYDKESIVVDIFKSAGWVDLTIKNGMVYIKRITDPDDASAKEEIYRMMPMENFTADILNQIDFIFNFGSTVSSALKGQSGSGESGGGTGTQAKKDYGTQLETYLKSYAFKEGGGENGGALWDLVITGSAISNVLSDIDIRLTSSGAETGVLRGLEASLTVVSLLKLNAKLRYRNPQNVMDAGVKNAADLTVQETLDHAMSAKANGTDWTSTTYLEGQLGSIKYTVDGKVVSEQNIVYDMNTKEFYSALTYPSFDGASEPPVGYHWEWNEPAELTPKMDIGAVAVPNTYHFTFKSEYAIDGYDNVGGTFTESGEYTYGQAFDLHIGTRVSGDNYVKELVGFRCKEGHLITSLADWKHFAEEKDLELTAVWEDVEFTVTFDVNGKITERKGIFGDKIDLPEEYENAKTGYTFTDWDGDVPETFSADMKFTAQYTPNTYVITFESEHEITDWAGVEFTKQGEMYVATYTFTYDSVFPLLLNVKAEHGAFILTGWTMNGDVYTNRLPNVLDATTFTAIWEEVGVDVYFANDDGTRLPGVSRNKHVGSRFTAEELPEVPQRNGYTGAWDIDLDTYTVPESGDGEGGMIVIRAKYTPITYVIHQYSLYPLKDYLKNGFERVDGKFDSEGVQGNVYYVRTLYYVFGSNRVTLKGGETLADHAVGVKKEGFDFMGFYSERFGAGAHIETINDDTIEKVFGWNVGNSENFAEQNTIFAHWKDNSITVRFYSDIQGTLMEGYDGQGRFHNVVYYDDKTQITYAPTATDGGYQLLGWFAKDPAAPGGWKMVTDVAEYRVDDNAATTEGKPYDVALYAVWIQTIKLEITVFSQTDILLGFQYNIHGTVEGGLPYPGTSQTIYNALGVTKETTGVYVLHGRGDKSDKLLFGEQVTVTPKEDDPNVGTFGEDGMNTATFGTRLTGQADYGGMVMQMKFTCGDASVAMVDAAVISRNTYTVTYYDQNKAVYKTVDGVRLNYTGTYTSSFFENKFAIDGQLASSSHVYADELAESNGIVCPQTTEEGRTYIWPHREITPDSLNIYPIYKTELQKVIFRADTRLDSSWQKEVDGDAPTGFYLYETQLYLEATVTYRDNSGELKTDTVVAGENVFDLPSSSEIRSIGKRQGKWGPTSFYYDPYGSTFTAEYGEDTVIYYSEVEFHIDYAGTDYKLDPDTQYTVTYQSEYTLWQPTSDGYTFLGWYTHGTDGKWSKVGDTLELAETAATTTVEALWVENIFTVTGTDIKRERERAGIFSYNYYYTATISVEGGTLTGAMANEVQVSMTYTHFVNNGATAVSDSDMGYTISTQEFKEYTASHSITHAQEDSKDYYHCVVILTYSYDGKELVKLRESVTSNKF